MRNLRSPIRPSASRLSRVTPGVSSTIAIFRPTSRLKSVDLPTLGRPTMATSALMMWSLSAPYGAEDEAIGADDAAGADEIGAADDAASDAGADDTPGAAIDNSELSTTTGGV